MVAVGLAVVPATTGPDSEQAPASAQLAPAPLSHSSSVASTSSRPRVATTRTKRVPLPLPGERATISCPHSYPLFYEPLGLKEGQTFLEVGVGSGYGTALAREVVGREGLVVGIDLDAATLAFAWGIWTGPATAPRFFFTATADWATRRTPPTTGSA
jgi:SAM-dependent methyltransferase